jgi:hypothetical protein
MAPLMLLLLLLLLLLLAAERAELGVSSASTTRGPLAPALALERRVTTPRAPLKTDDGGSGGDDDGAGAGDGGGDDDAAPRRQGLPSISAPQTRFLLLDRRVVERAEGHGHSNVSLVLGRATKEPANPLMCEDRPWEVTWLNTGACMCLYATLSRAGWL